KGPICKMRYAGRQVSACDRRGGRSAPRVDWPARSIPDVMSVGYPFRGEVYSSGSRAEHASLQSKPQLKRDPHGCAANDGPGAHPSPVGCSSLWQQTGRPNEYNSAAVSKTIPGCPSSLLSAPSCHVSEVMSAERRPENDRDWDTDQPKQSEAHV